MKKLLQKIINKETIMYLVFGVCTTIINWVCFAMFSKIFAGDTSSTGDVMNVKAQLLAKVTGAGGLSWLIAVLFAYVTNRLFVFSVRAHGFVGVLTELGKFIGARIVTGLIEIFGVPLLMLIGLNQTFLGIEGSVAKAVISIAVIVLNYVFSKLFVFKGKKTEGVVNE